MREHSQSPLHQDSLRRAVGEFGRAAALPPPEDVRARGNRRRRNRAIGSAVMALALLAGGGSATYLTIGHTHRPGPVLNTGSPSPSASHAPAPSPSPSTSTPAAMLPAGKVGPRSAVPWPLVGPGWTLAEYTTAPATPPGQTSPPTSTPVSLYLVDPEGGRYTMYTWPSAQRAWTLIDWSGDKTRALFHDPYASPGRPAMHQLELKNGTITSFTPPKPAGAVHYTRPDGTNLLALTGSSPGTFKAQRYSLQGVLQVTFATGRVLSFPVDSPDGTEVAVGTGTGVEVIGNTGGKGHSITVPGVDNRIGCAVVRWWNNSTVLAHCRPAKSTDVSRLWLVPADGGTPSALTPVRTSNRPTPGNVPDLGDVNAWRLPSGLYLQVLAACGGIYIARQSPVGSLTPVRFPGSTGHDLVLTVSGNRMLVYASSVCSWGGSLLWLNPATGAVQPLLTRPAGERGVIGALAYRQLGN